MSENNINTLTEEENKCLESNVETTDDVNVETDDEQSEQDVDNSDNKAKFDKAAGLLDKFMQDLAQVFGSDIEAIKKQLGGIPIAIGVMDNKNCCCNPLMAHISAAIEISEEIGSLERDMELMSMDLEDLYVRRMEIMQGVIKATTSDKSSDDVE